MADLTNELNKIKHAVYGEEVRDSIIDGLNKINYESTEQETKVNNKIDEFDDYLGDLYSSETLSGSIIHIEDAASVPVKAMKVKMEPKQDLNGYTKPWVGGAGKNLFDFENDIFSGGEIAVRSVSGNVTTITTPATITRGYSSTRSNNRTLKGGTTYAFSCHMKAITKDSTYNPRFSIRNASSNEILASAQLQVEEADISNTYTPSEDVEVYLSIIITGNNTTNPAEVQVSNVQFEIGSTATAYEPYSNICPITGYSSAEIVASPTDDTEDEDANRYTIPFGQTVYGGVLDVTGSKIVVDRAMTTLADKTFGQRQSSILPAGGFIPVSGFAPSIDISGIPISDMLHGTDNAHRGEEGTIAPNVSSSTLYLFTSLQAAEAKAKYGDATIVYYLATPIEIPIDPVTVSTLKGENYVSASCGDITEFEYVKSYSILNEQNKARYDDLESYVRDMSPLATVGPADIVSIEDAAPLSAEGLKVDVEPVQDLHGYTKPWVGGAGKNILSGLEQGGIYGNTGTDSPSPTENRLRSEDPVAVTVGQIYTITMQTTAEKTLQFSVSFYPAIGEQRIVNSGWQTSPYTVQAPANANVMALLVRFSDDSNIVPADVYNAQIELGSTATAYEPYSNICPITGWEGVTVTDEGKNLCDESKLLLANGWTENNGVYSGENSALHSVFNNGFPGINFKADTIYTVSLKFRSATASKFTVVGFKYTDGTQSVIYMQGTDDHTESHTSTAGKSVSYLFLSYGSGNTVYISQLQVEEGSTATSYEPYKSRTASASFPSTVYGVTVDLATGECVVDRAGELLKNKTFTMNLARLETTLDHDFLNAYRDQSISSAYKYNIQVLGSSCTNYNGCFAMLESGRRLLIYDERYTTTESIPDFLEEMGDTMIVYPLATPTTFTLAPAELELFKGTNNISADAGQVTVTYRQDAYMALMKKINDLEALVIDTEGGN